MPRKNGPFSNDLGAFDEEDENTGTKFPFPLFQFELTSRCPKEFCTFTVSRSCISKLFGTCTSCVSCSDKCAWNKMTCQYDCTQLESTTMVAAPEMDEDEVDEAAGGIVRPDRRTFIFDQLSSLQDGFDESRIDRTQLARRTTSEKDGRVGRR